MKENQERYFSRELSWIEFNRRVLAEAMDESNPLLERLKFAGIVSSNFDEFFMVRVAGVSSKDPLFRVIYDRAFALIREQHDYFHKTLIPLLEKEGIRRLCAGGLSEKQREYLRNLFRNEIEPLLTPIALHEGRPFPNTPHLSICRMFSLVDPNQPKEKKYAVIEMPRNYSGMMMLPCESGYSFMLLSDVVEMFASELFPGHEVIEQGVFRVTRTAELTLDEEKDEDFAKVMSEALTKRLLSQVVRLEFSGSEELLQRIRFELEVPDVRIFRQDDWVDIHRISQIAFQSVFPELKRPLWQAPAHPDLEKADDVWTCLRQKDIVTLHPYQTFDDFLRFLSQAARDPEVLAIKQTLYRTGSPSRVIALLEEAALNGKQVTVLVELKARFDEERNIEWAERLINAGAVVLYGVAGYKTHAKACLVMRREPEGIRRYLHLSTGNYNEKTAQVYSDVGYFTSRESLAKDINAFFNLITGFSSPVGFSEIEIAPYGLRRRFLKMIDREILRSTKETPGLIMAKMNSLVDHEMIEALYKASQKNVKIRLNIRGICCLKPGVKGMSENIEVVSVVDMFLEHSRMFYFANGGDEELYLSSADWMPRNLDRRLEVMWPVTDPRNKQWLLEVLGAYFKDNIKSWQLYASGAYVKKTSGNERKFRVQEFLCKRILDSAQHSAEIKEIKPQKPKGN